MYSDANGGESSLHDDGAAVSDGVIAFWVQCLDILGNPVPILADAKNHPDTNLIYNSAGYFNMAFVHAVTAQLDEAQGVCEQIVILGRFGHGSTLQRRKQ